MEKNPSPLVSAAELEALIHGWGALPHQSVDRFFPVRFWYIFSVVLLAASWLLFDSHRIAQTLTTDATYLPHLQNFLYFRGWFLIGVMALGVYAYLWNWFPAIVFSAFLLLGVTNLVFDLFTVYPERLANPQPLFTLMMLVRLSSLWVLYMSVKNASRMPAPADRANILLPFRRGT